MSVGPADENVVRLIPDVLEDQYLKWETKELKQFTIIDTTLDNVSEDTASLKMTIRLKRKITSEMMTTYLPSVLLMTITFATTFFKPIWFEAALSVNLTTMLMMTTISIEKMQTLPTTAYIRMIDVWLVFCQLIPFAEVIILTALDYSKEEDERRTPSSDDTSGKQEKQAWIRKSYSSGRKLQNIKS